MKKLFVLLAAVLCIGIVAGCSDKKEETDTAPLPQMVEVDLSINPEPGVLNQPITLEAKVTQGNDKVEDADVVFEIWRSKDDKHEKIEIKHSEEGIYRLEKSFSREGTYYIISHVTARDMHNMPKEEFTIGNPSEPEESTSKESMDGMEMDDTEDTNEGH
jgi:YtkA-like